MKNIMIIFVVCTLIIPSVLTEVSALTITKNNEKKDPIKQREY